MSVQIFDLVSHETFPDVSLTLYTSIVYSDDCTLVCKTGMDIGVKPELPGMNKYALSLEV